MSDSTLSSDALPDGGLPPVIPNSRPPSRKPAAILTLDNPIPTQALPLLWDESSYTLPVAVHSDPLQVTIERVWPANLANLAMTTEVKYYWQGLFEFQHNIVGPYDPDVVFPLTVELPDRLTSTGGIRRLHYTVSSPFISLTESFPTFVNVDKSAPNSGNPGQVLIFDAEALVEVTEDYLVRNGGVPVQIPRWLDIRTEDTVEFFWSELPNVAQVGQVVIQRAQVEGAPLLYTFPEAFVRSSGTGSRFVSYRLIDRAGNVGPFSELVEIKVSLVSLPDLPRLKVPLADADGLINLDDARQGVIILIDQITDALPGDQVTPFWGSHPLPSTTIGDVQAWPIRVTVPWAILAAGGFDAAYPVRVRYLYRRGTASENSPDNFYKVDLTVAGTHPVGPDPINPGLKLVIVKGVTGDNIVTSADAPGPVRVEVPLFDNPEPGERLELYWGNDGNYAGDYTVSPGDVGGQIIAIFVPWPVISPVTHPAVEVYYWTDNGINRQRSPFTPVRVEFDTLIGLQAPNLLNDSGNNSIRCGTQPEPWEGVFIGVSWNTQHFDIGDSIRLYWKSYPTQNGSGAHFEGTDVFFDQVLTADHQDIGQVVIQIQPFNPLITLPGLVNPNGFGSAVVSYRLFKAAGPSGVSSRKLLYVDLYRPGGDQTCLGPVGNGESL